MNFSIHFFKALPVIVQLIAKRFQRQIITNELRLMLIQVLIVILWLNPDRFFQILNTVVITDPTTQNTIGNFFIQWMNDCHRFIGIHDRRICALGLCTLLRIDAKYYSAINNIVDKILYISCQLTVTVLMLKYSMISEIILTLLIKMGKKLLRF